MSTPAATRTDTHPAYAMGAVEWMMLITLATVWGGSFFFNKIALRELPPFTLVWVRSVLGAILLLGLVRLSGGSLVQSRSVWRTFMVMGVLNNLLPFSLISYGQTQIASGLASILNATTPLFTVVVAHIVTRDERMTMGKLAGVLFGMVGVVVMIGIDALRGIGLNVFAQFACLTAALSYACASLYGRRLRGVPAMVSATGPIICGAVLMAPLALVVDHPWKLRMPGAETWGAMIGLAVLCTALSYFLYFRILAAAGATNLMLVTFLIPLSALLLGASILDEVIEPRQFAGMALIFIGLAAIDGRLFRFLRHS